MTAPTLPAAPPPMPDVDEFLGRVHGRDASGALDLVTTHMRAGGTVTEVVSDLLAPAQRDVGERWHAGDWTVADEHAASSVVEDALGVLAAHLPRSSGQERLTLVCAEGEWHTTPARMAALTLRDAGWHVDFLGGSTPSDHLRTAIQRTRPGVLAVSATLPLSLAGVASTVAVAHELDVPVLVGGAAFAGSEHRARMVSADGFAPDLADAAATLRGWLDHPPARRLASFDPEWRRQHRSLVDHRDDLVDAAYTLLLQRIPSMRHFTEVQLDHTRRDLAFTLRFLDTALLVEDRELFRTYTAWLQSLLAHRGLPASVVRASYDALAEVVGTGRDVAHELLHEELPA